MASAPKVIVEENLTRQVARLARLELTDEEVKTFTSQLGNIVQYMDLLQQVNVEGVEPLISPLDQITPLRSDVVVPSALDDSGFPKVLQPAPDLLDNGFKVPQIK